MQALELIEPEETTTTPPPAPVARPLSVIQYAMQSGATASEVRAMMELQVQSDNHQMALMQEKRRMDEEDRKRNSELAFRRDFAAFSGEGIVVPKSKFVDRGRAGSFYQAEFGQISTMLKAPLSRHGFGVRFNEVFGSRRIMVEGKENDIPWVFVTCYLEHRDGHTERLDLEGPPGDMSANTPTQNMQVTGSYLKRQALLAITGTATQDEDNENKMRRRETPDEGGNSQAGEAEALLQAGRDAALQGIATLNKWWGALTGKQRNLINQDFKGLRAAAVLADQNGSAK